MLLQDIENAEQSRRQADSIDLNGLQSSYAQVTQ